MALGQLQDEADLERWITSRVRGWVKPLLAGAAKLAGLDFGSSTYSLAATTATSNTISHALGVAPSCVVAVSDDHTLVVGVDNLSTTQLRVKVHTYDNVARTQSGAFYWLAVV